MRRDIALRYARKPEAKAKARDRYQRACLDPEFKRKVKDQRLRRAFGITLETFEAWVQKQGGKCALCLKDFGPWGNRTPLAPVVDHSHATGQIRGILHRKCNSAIGFLEDSAEIAARAAAYLGVV